MNTYDTEKFNETHYAITLVILQWNGPFSQSTIVIFLTIMQRDGQLQDCVIVLLCYRYCTTQTELTWYIFEVVNLQNTLMIYCDIFTQFLERWITFLIARNSVYKRSIIVFCNTPQ